MDHFMRLIFFLMEDLQADKWVRAREEKFTGTKST